MTFVFNVLVTLAIKVSKIVLFTSAEVDYFPYSKGLIILLFSQPVINYQHRVRVAA